MATYDMILVAIGVGVLFQGYCWLRLEWLRIRSRSRDEAGLCSWCAYPRGFSARCPECGRDYCHSTSCSRNFRKLCNASVIVSTAILVVLCAANLVGIARLLGVPCVLAMSTINVTYGDSVTTSGTAFPIGPLGDRCRVWWYHASGEREFGAADIQCRLGMPCAWLERRISSDSEGSTDATIQLWTQMALGYSVHRRINGWTLSVDILGIVAIGIVRTRSRNLLWSHSVAEGPSE